jgi:hypothetical protein
VICCDVISGLVTRRVKRRHLENLGHAAHVMYGKSGAKVYHHAVPVSIEASSAYLLGVKPQAKHNRSMIFALCHLFLQLKIPFLTLFDGIFMTMSIFTLILSIQCGRFFIEIHLTSIRSLVYFFNPLSQLDYG